MTNTERSGPPTPREYEQAPVWKLAKAREAENLKGRLVYLDGKDGDDPKEKERLAQGQAARGETVRHWRRRQGGVVMAQTIDSDAIAELMANELRKEARILAKGDPDDRARAHRLRALAVARRVLEGEAPLSREERLGVADLLTGDRRRSRFRDGAPSSRRASPPGGVLSSTAYIFSCQSVGCGLH